MVKNYKLPLKTYRTAHRLKEYLSSTSRKGSITVEAAIAVPIFFLAVVCLLYLMEMMAVQTAVRSGRSTQEKGQRRNMHKTFYADEAIGKGSG